MFCYCNKTNQVCFFNICFRNKASLPYRKIWKNLRTSLRSCVIIYVSEILLSTPCQEMWATEEHQKNHQQINFSCGTLIWLLILKSLHYGWLTFHTILFSYLSIPCNQVSSNCQEDLSVKYLFLIYIALLKSALNGTGCFGMTETT